MSPKVVQNIDLQTGEPTPSPLMPPAPAPLLPMALGLMAGVLLDDRLPQGQWVYGVVMILCAASLLRTKRHRYLSVAMLVIASAGLGAIRYDLHFRRIASDHIVHRTGTDPMLCRLRGRVVTTPEIVEPSPTVPRAYETGPRTRFIMEAEQVEPGETMVPASGRLMVSVKAPLLLLRIGDFIEMTGWLYRPRGPVNPGEYDRRLANQRAGSLAGFSCDHAESVRVVDRVGADWRGSLGKLRLRLGRLLLHESLSEDEPEAGVIEAVVLGHRDAVSRAMNEAFVRTGNAHFLAASGMNVAWVALVGWAVMSLTGAYYRTRAVAMALLILAYVLVAEPEPSIQRAGIMGLIGCMTLFQRGRASVLNWLACSAVVVLMLDPADLFRAGFQLSFLGALGASHVASVVRATMAPPMIRAADRIGLRPYLVAYGFMPREADPHIVPDDSLRGEIVVWIVKGIGLSVSVSLACWLVTAPLCCYTFGQIAPWGILGSLVLWVPAFAVTIIGFAKLGLGLLFPSSALLLGPLLAWASRLMVGLVDVLSHLPGTLIDGRRPSLAWVIAAYAVIAWRVYGTKWLIFPHRFKLAALVIVLWWSIPPRWVTQEAGALKVWMLAVGDGTGTVVELPNGKVLMVDFGTMSKFSAGNVGVAFLRERGIRRVDTAFLSHADFDHYSGISAIAKELEIERLVLNDHFQPYVKEKSEPWYFLKAMGDAGVPVEVVSGPREFEGMGDVRVESIWPPHFEKGGIATDNDRSMVLRLTYQGKRVLLTGDIAVRGMAGLLQQGDLKADVLALPHHGSVVANTKSFIDAVDPTVCVRSSGQRRKMTRNGIERCVGERRYFSTADDGCVVVKIANGAMTTESNLNKK